MADLKLADIVRDAEILVAARREAFDLVAGDPVLADHPLLAEEVRALLGADVDWLFR
jgi:ATP-dependent DNA helicase RecG